MDYLRTRFKDKEDILANLLNCLDNEAINETKNPGMSEYDTISAERLGLILTSIAKYDCGKNNLFN